MKKYIKMLLATCLVATLGSCTLGVQEQFDFKGETYSEEDPFANITAWDYIQTRKSNAIRDAQGRFKLVSNTSVLGASGDELDFMIAAIKKVGYEDLYNQTETTSRTYLLLNNNAFTGNNDRDIIKSIRGAQLADNSTVNPDTYFDNWTPEQLNLLKAVLKYHIVTDFVAQKPTIPTYDVYVLFKTLLPKVVTDGAGLPVSLSEDKAAISFSRDVDARSTLKVNESGSPLPETANTAGWDENVRRHNYVFSNGIGHYLNESVRYQPYSLYNNFTIE
ncbi:hypothetical protein B6A10_05925 [Flavobacterium sp. L1I52]|uniref:Fasciclin domain-containing protein n=1 Tax=Flavobacterium pokkalii TaxID=1940408 RepID=A0ABR7UPA4_9FLAO|nr:hypothetical protein [Flavobacterium pokkalii]MBD0724711.1 hypothetical protein [Flavobacterium pokkalii]